MSNPHVMVIDDEVNICTLIATYFEKYGIRVVYANSVDEAEKMLAQFTPRLIFCDYSMPGRTGFDFLAEAINKGLPCKIVMLTAHAEKDMVLEGLGLGCVDYVAKPFDLKKLADDAVFWLELINKK